MVTTSGRENAKAAAAVDEPFAVTVDVARLTLRRYRTPPNVWRVWHTASSRLGNPVVGAGIHSQSVHVTLSPLPVGESATGVGSPVYAKLTRLLFDQTSPVAST